MVGASARAKARVELLKGALIFVCGGARGRGQIGWRLGHPGTPVVETMGLAALVNLGANLVCLAPLSPLRHGDLNLASAWECSRNDVAEGLAVILAAAGVWWLGAGWPDVLIATALLALFLRSALRVLGAAWRELRAGG